MTITGTVRRSPTKSSAGAAVPVGVEGKDWETVVLETSSTFWDLIEKRRRESTLSTEELEDSLK